MLDLKGVRLTDSLRNEISMIVRLRCLIIKVEAEALSQSFSNLCNLETLQVLSLVLSLSILSVKNMVLSPSIWSLAKLRHVDIRNCSVIVSDIDKPTKLENLITLEFLNLSIDSEDIFNRFPNLRTLKFVMDCSAAEQISFPRLDVLNNLEKVTAYFMCRWLAHVHQFDFHFPASLKQTKLDGFNLTSDALSRVGRSTPNLQKLKLSNARIQGGEEWNMEQVTFHNLKYLKSYDVIFFEWQVIPGESFPLLEELHIYYCEELKEIPEDFGDIASL